MIFEIFSRFISLRNLVWNEQIIQKKTSLSCHWIHTITSPTLLWMKCGMIAIKTSSLEVQVHQTLSLGNWNPCPIKVTSYLVFPPLLLGPHKTSRDFCVSKHIHLKSMLTHQERVHTILTWWFHEIPGPPRKDTLWFLQAESFQSESTKKTVARIPGGEQWTTNNIYRIL